MDYPNDFILTPGRIAAMLHITSPTGAFVGLPQADHNRGTLDAIFIKEGDISIGIHNQPPFDKFPEPLKAAITRHFKGVFDTHIDNRERYLRGLQPIRVTA